MVIRACLELSVKTSSTVVGARVDERGQPLLLVLAQHVELEHAHRAEHPDQAQDQQAARPGRLPAGPENGGQDDDGPDLGVLGRLDLAGAELEPGLGALVADPSGVRTSPRPATTAPKTTGAQASRRR